MKREKSPGQKKKKKPKPQFDRSDILSILAVVASLIALGVSIYEARLLRQQSLLMQEQQKAAVWPYLEMIGNYFYDEKAEVTYSFKNKGVGPAKIESFKVSVNGNTFSDYNELSGFFKKLMPGAREMSVSYGALGGVIAADEEIEVFHLIVGKDRSAYEVVRQLDFKYEICYCSIYGECWFLDSNADGPVDSNCDKQ